MNLHNKFGFPISKNIGDMHQFLETRSDDDDELEFNDASTLLGH